MRTSFDYFSSNILEKKQTTESIISSTSTATNIRLTSFEVTNETKKIEEKTKNYKINKFTDFNKNINIRNL